MNKLKQMTKIIHAHVYDPRNSIFGSKTSKAKCTTISCNASETCGLFKRGECMMLNFSGGRCPYGIKKTIEGFTSKARKSSEWINDKRKQYIGIPSLKIANAVMTTIGEYVYLPYSFMNMNETVPFLSYGGGFRSGSDLMLKSDFTIDVIKRIYEFVPYAMMGGEIKDYQTKHVPMFIKHLSEIFPELYKQLVKVLPEIKLIVTNYNYVGRLAILSTITPNVGQLKDIHGGLWTWDGTYLTSNNSHASFLLINRDEFTELRLKPNEGVSVKITDNRQVNKLTIFKD